MFTHYVSDGGDPITFHQTRPQGKQLGRGNGDEQNKELLLPLGLISERLEPSRAIKPLLQNYRFSQSQMTNAHWTSLNTLILCRSTAL